MRLLLFPLVLMNRLNKTESAVFLYCRFSLFLKDPFFPEYLEVVAAIVVLRGRVKHLRVHQYRFDIFSIFWSFRNFVLLRKVE